MHLLNTFTLKIAKASHTLNSRYEFVLFFLVWERDKEKWRGTTVGKTRNYFARIRFREGGFRFGYFFRLSSFLKRFSHRNRSFILYKHYITIFFVFLLPLSFSFLFLRLVNNFVEKHQTKINKQMKQDGIVGCKCNKVRWIRIQRSEFESDTETCQRCRLQSSTRIIRTGRRQRWTRRLPWRQRWTWWWTRKRP